MLGSSALSERDYMEKPARLDRLKWAKLAGVTCDGCPNVTKKIGAFEVDQKVSEIK